MYLTYRNYTSDVTPYFGVINIILSKGKYTFITERDLQSSGTLHLLSDLSKLLGYIGKKKVTKMLDLGCGYGGLTALIAKYLNAVEAWGVDIRDDVRKEVEEKGVKFLKLDVEKEKFPFPDRYFQLVTTFGALDHIAFWDNVMSEAHRVLEHGYYFIVSVTNLANIFDRIAFLFGFQPRHVEISKVKVFGVPRIYYAHPTTHIHTATYRALKEMLEYYGFKILRVYGSTKIIGPWKGFTSYFLKPAYKAIATIRPQLALRLFVLAQKNESE